jgi:EAL domain-containing protein (putative c-di-GMP-specific phosphodiesterase class I)
MSAPPIPLRPPPIDDNVFVDAVVLLADDHEPNLALLHQILAREGASNLHLTTDPASVVELYRTVRPDVVLLDLHMPGLDGVAVMDAIREVTPPDDFVPVIVLTADATTTARDRVLAAGASDFLTKPVDRTEVVLRTRNLLHNRRLHRNMQQYNAELRREIDERNAIEREALIKLDQQRRVIRRVLTDHGMRTVFQPIAELRSGRTVGYEALTRFDRLPHRPPNEWFDEATHVGLGVELELAAVEAALRSLPTISPDAFLTLNVSPLTATTTDFIQLIEHQPLERLVLEITEHAQVNDYDTLLATLTSVSDRGMRIAVDDAGAGYASLQHILRLRPDIIKLDIALVRDIDRDPIRRALASSLVTFADEIGSTLTAEGIETVDELNSLVRLGVPWGQGFYIGRPGDLPATRAHEATAPEPSR